jgi:predicted DNA-binding transcriptional regulator AlpA
MNTKEITSARVDRALAQLAAARINPDTRFGVIAMETITGYGRRTIYRLCRAGKLPRPIAPGRWRGGDVLEYLVKARMSEAVNAQ